VDERSRVLLAMLTGALVGGAWGYLYLTEGGRRIRQQAEPRIDDFVTEIRRMRRTVEKARAAATESLNTLQELTASERPWRDESHVTR